MAISFDQVNVYVKRLVQEKLHTSFIKTKPLLAMLAGTALLGAPNAHAGLADPGTAIVFGGANLGIGQRLERVNSNQHEFRYQKAETDAAAAVTLAGTTPTSTLFADDNAGLAATRWSHFAAPVKVREHRLLMANGDLQIASIVEEALGMNFKQALDKLYTDLWTGTLDETAQDLELWANNIGIKHITDDGVTQPFYARVDRTIGANQQLKGNELAAGTDAVFADPAAAPVKLGGFRRVRILDSLGGVANKDPNAGTLVITTPDLWDVLANEAEGKHQIFDDGQSIPGFGLSTGFTFPIIKKDQVMITYDPLCPSGEVYQLSPNNFVFEIHPALNFKVEDWNEKWKVVEGGDFYRWTLIHAMTRFTCYDPHLQTRITGATA